jgi:tetratricopeptide (TPR) repeat protein
VALQNAVQLGREGNWRAEAAQRLQLLEVDPATADAAKLAALAAQFPGDTILATRLGAVAERDGAWDKAAAHYESALKINPKLVPVMVKLAQLNATHLKNHNRAFELARRARELEPEDPRIAHTLGRLAYLSAETAADFQWAHGLLQQSARSLPDDPEVLSDYALAAFAIGQVTNAIATMQKVLDAKPPPRLAEQASLFMEINSLLAKPSDIGKAAGRVRAVLQQQPDYVPVMMADALLKESSGDFAGAKDVYQNVLRRSPLFSPAKRALALLFFGPLQDSQKAYDFAVAARDAFPSDPQVARVLGILSFQRGEYSRAVQLLDESTKAFPKDAEILYSLGFSQMRLKQSAAGKLVLAKALELAPNSSSAQEARKLLLEAK